MRQQQIQRRRRLLEKLLVVVGFGPLPDGSLVLIEARNACTSVTSPMGRGSDGSSRYRSAQRSDSSCGLAKDFMEERQKESEG
jgi:hypothetical protein